MQLQRAEVLEETAMAAGLISSGPSELAGKIGKVPRQSLRRGRQKSISPQGSGFQTSTAQRVAPLDEFTPSNTLAWYLPALLSVRAECAALGQLGQDEPAPI